MEKRIKPKICIWLFSDLVSVGFSGQDEIMKILFAGELNVILWVIKSGIHAAFYSRIFRRDEVIALFFAIEQVVYSCFVYYFLVLAVGINLQLLVKIFNIGVIASGKYHRMVVMLIDLY